MHTSSINIKKKIKRRLCKYGHKGESWSDILDRVLSHLDECDKWWSEEE